MRASSISLVNIPLVPTLASATSVILSPVVLMISTSTVCPRARSRSEMCWACQSANCEPREPMRRRAISFLVLFLHLFLYLGHGLTSKPRCPFLPLRHAGCRVIIVQIVAQVKEATHQVD